VWSDSSEVKWPSFSSCACVGGWPNECIFKKNEIASRVTSYKNGTITFGKKKQKKTPVIIYHHQAHAYTHNCTPLEKIVYIQVTMR
jgi:predicted NodU family carbamoyl transferase